MVSFDKSCFLRNGVDEDVLTKILGILPFKEEWIEAGIKYLSYKLNPNNYLIRDWNWLIRKFEARIQN